MYSVFGFLFFFFSGEGGGWGNVRNARELNMVLMYVCILYIVQLGISIDDL